MPGGASGVRGPGSDPHRARDCCGQHRQPPGGGEARCDQRGYSPPAAHPAGRADGYGDVCTPVCRPDAAIGLRAGHLPQEPGGNRTCARHIGLPSDRREDPMTPAEQIALWADRLRDISAMGLLFAKSIHDRTAFERCNDIYGDAGCADGERRLPQGQFARHWRRQECIPLSRVTGWRVSVAGSVAQSAAITCTDSLSVRAAGAWGSREAIHHRSAGFRLVC